MSDRSDIGDTAAKAPHGIADVARSAGVSSRTLRHYDAIGLLPATAVGDGGLRRYDDRALVRLQRILLLRGLGLGLTEIARVLDGEQDDVTALTAHVAWLERERDRLARQLAAVRTTITRIEKGEDMNATDTFDGFDQTRFRQEVEERWGPDAWQHGTTWWQGKDATGKQAFQEELRAIARDAAALAASDDASDSPAAEALARRQFAWLAEATPAAELTAERFRTLAEMYVHDERFAHAYDWAGAGAARALRDAMVAFADGGL
ncbi:MerR family transcriptional regulator [Curtobacterium sp. PhB115]|uniref:MerR family transcriptional regulator n=1 Tax=Curtobacterium sp. PhB115 TaxID=2485173 RepID=UPI000F4BA704|nr:MerR family transcriptional regulator [Curtobacterium sp. PhB115]ROP74687.1 DNA-binding transcriptional MerR regulator [Curtobacterium sp. PhB115]